MINQKDRKLYELSDKGKDFSKSVHSWLAQYDEEDDFFVRELEKMGWGVQSGGDEEGEAVPDGPTEWDGGPLQLEGW